jgi:hypothetical protein
VQESKRSQFKLSSERAATLRIFLSLRKFPTSHRCDSNPQLSGIAGEHVPRVLAMYKHEHFRHTDTGTIALVTECYRLEDLVSSRVQVHECFSANISSVD